MDRCRYCSHEAAHQTVGARACKTAWQLDEMIRIHLPLDKEVVVAFIDINAISHCKLLQLLQPSVSFK